MPVAGGYWLPLPVRTASAAALAMADGPSTSGNPWPRLTELVATARADITPKMELPRPSRRRLSSGRVTTPTVGPALAVRLSCPPGYRDGMRIALCQLPGSSDPGVNLRRVREALRDAALSGAELAVFPEATMARFGSGLRAAAEPLDGPFCSDLAAAAKETGVALVAGVFEPAPGGRVYHTAVVIDGGGALVASYRKLHLFNAFTQR